MMVGYLRSPTQASNKTMTNGPRDTVKHGDDYHSPIQASIVGSKYSINTVNNNIYPPGVSDVHITSARHQALNILRDASAQGATYNAFGQHNACDDDTRIIIRDEVLKWIQNKDGYPMYWLKGPAGYGKSALTRTVAEMCARQTPNRLLASFFFARKNTEDRRNALCFFPTIAFQLIRSVPSTESPVLDAVFRSTESIRTTSLQNQLQMLVIDPLKLAELSSPMIIVVDALDECEDHTLAAEIITILADAFCQNPGLPLRVFISSRPEEAIRERMTEPTIAPMIQPFSLSDVSARDDIRNFLRRRFVDIKKKRREYMSEEWPAESQIEKIVEKSCGLFQYASVMLDFINMDQKHPSEQLKIVLDTQDATDPLHQLYTEIFTRSYTNLVTRSTVETIILLFNPLPPSEVDRLLTQWPSCHYALRGLHSILFVPNEPGTSVRIFHVSAYEFLTSPRCPPEFFIDQQEGHTNIARLCLRMMTGSLKRDLYNMDLGIRPKVNLGFYDNGHKREEALNGALRYACRYWAKHLSFARADGDIVGYLQAFGSKRILNWIEALNLAGNLDSAIPSLQGVRQWLRDNVPDCPPELPQILSDTERLLSSGYETISTSALEVYNSALLLVPSGSLLFTTYLCELRETRRRLDNTLLEVRAALRN